MRRVIMIFEVDNVKKEAELKAKVMQVAQVVKAKLKRLEGKSIKDDNWKYPSNY
ncbi:hypothetical protein JCM11957_07110 [Caminibacter profundus]